MFKKYTEEYLNTGGHCMVLEVKFRDELIHEDIFVDVNDECATVATKPLFDREGIDDELLTLYANSGECNIKSAGEYLPVIQAAVRSYCSIAAAQQEKLLVDGAWWYMWQTLAD